MVLQLEDELVNQVSAEARRRGKTLEGLVAEVLRQQWPLPCSTPGQQGGVPTHDLGGARPGIDFDDGRKLRELMDKDGLARC